MFVKKLNKLPGSEVLYDVVGVGSVVLYDVVVGVGSVVLFDVVVVGVRREVLYDIVLGVCSVVLYDVVVVGVRREVLYDDVVCVEAGDGGVQHLPDLQHPLTQGVRGRGGRLADP